MKKCLVFCLSLAFCLVLLIPLTAFADDRPQYEYTIAYFPSDNLEFDEHYPAVNLNLSRPLTLAGGTWSPGEDVRLDYSSYGHLVIGVYNPLYEEDPNDEEFLSRYEYITVNDLPIVFYSYSSSLARSDSSVITGTLVVPETTLPETTSAPSEYNNSVSSGLTASVGFLGSIASWMLSDTVILVVIGLAVGVTLISWGIGKVKSFVKGY